MDSLNDDQLQAMWTCTFFVGAQKSYRSCCRFQLWMRRPDQAWHVVTLNKEQSDNEQITMGILGSPLPAFEHVSSARVKMDELLVFWVSQKETDKLLRGYLEAVAADQPLDKPGSSCLVQTLSSPSSSTSLPLSPRSLSPLKSPGGPGTGPAGLAHRSPTSKSNWSPHPSSRSERFERFHSPEKRSPSRSSGVSEESSRSRPLDASRKVPDEGRARVRRADIPRFWVKGEGGRGRGRPIPCDSLEARRQEMERLFERHPDGLGVDDFVPVTKTLCGFPSFFNAVLFKRIFARTQVNSVAQTQSEHKGSPGGEGTEGAGSGVGADELPADARISLALFQEFWKDEIETYDYIDRFFRLVKKPENSFIEKVRDSICALLQGSHVELAFIRVTSFLTETTASCHFRCECHGMPQPVWHRIS